MVKPCLLHAIPTPAHRTARFTEPSASHVATQTGTMKMLGNFPPSHQCAQILFSRQLSNAKMCPKMCPFNFDPNLGERTSYQHCKTSRCCTPAAVGLSFSVPPP